MIPGKVTHHDSFGQMISIVHFISERIVVRKVEVFVKCRKKWHDPLQNVEDGAIGRGFEIWSTCSAAEHWMERKSEKKKKKKKRKTYKNYM